MMEIIGILKMVVWSWRPVNWMVHWCRCKVSRFLISTACSLTNWNMCNLEWWRSKLMTITDIAHVMIFILISNSDCACHPGSSTVSADPVQDWPNTQGLPKYIKKIKDKKLSQASAYLLDPALRLSDDELYQRSLMIGALINLLLLLYSISCAEPRSSRLSVSYPSSQVKHSKNCETALIKVLIVEKVLIV